MPSLFLSPSTQDFNPYVTNGNEEYWMNALADRMTPYLEERGISVTRNAPSGSAAFTLNDSTGPVWVFVGEEYTVRFAAQGATYLNYFDGRRWIPANAQGGEYTMLYQMEEPGEYEVFNISD